MVLIAFLIIVLNYFDYICYTTYLAGSAAYLAGSSFAFTFTLLAYYFQLILLLCFCFQRCVPFPLYGIIFDENTDSDTVSSVSAKKNFDDDLPKIKRFVGNPKPMSFRKNWYLRPTPPDMQFEERAFQT